MDSAQSRSLIRETFTQPFDKGRFRYFAINLLNHIDIALNVINKNAHVIHLSY